MKLEINKLL
jgi:hypothetical protein